MKFVNLYSSIGVILGGVICSSCSNYNTSESLSGGFNPLDPAGSAQQEKVEEAVVGSSDYAPGTFLATQASGAALFSRVPTASDQPIKNLVANTDVKVISSKRSYTKIEVVDTGEVGFVPTIMLGQKRSPNEIPVVPGIDGLPEAELPELLPTEATIPSVDNEIPDSFNVVEDVPFVAPEPENQGIKPPEVVDPLLPAE